MKILSSRQMHELDAKTIEHEGITSLALMERAANKLALAIVHIVKITNPHYVIFCGGGNNGGDGLAIARIFHSWGDDVDCYAIRDFKHYSDDYQSNYKTAKDTGILHNINSVDDIPCFQENDIIIDAIFGSGLNRPVTGLSAQIIRKVNSSRGIINSVIAVDIPSGLSDEGVAGKDDVVMQADYTFTVEIPFLSTLLPENEFVVGTLKTINIGLYHEAVGSFQSDYQLTHIDIVRPMLRQRRKFSHKGTFGHTLVAAGSYGKAGAAILCSRACHRAGTGLLTTHVPANLVDIMQTATPETMISVDSNSGIISCLPSLMKFSAVAIGPGIGTSDVTAKALEAVLAKLPASLVLDADALNIISENPSLMSMIPKETVLTPHPKEFERLFGPTKNSMHRLQVLKTNAQKYGIIIVLKGAYTAVALPDGSIHFNTTGNPGMATAGSGDVLTGIIAALISQRYTPAQAAVIGVFVHGLAGDIAAERLGQQGIIASDIIESVPLAFKKLLSQ